MNCKGFIMCPVCKKSKVVAGGDASGKASIQCPKCKKFSVYDFSDMSAIVANAIKGATAN